MRPAKDPPSVDFNGLSVSQAFFCVNAGELGRKKEHPNMAQEPHGGGGPVMLVDDSTNTQNIALVVKICALGCGVVREGIPNVEACHNVCAHSVELRDCSKFQQKGEHVNFRLDTQRRF